MPRRCTCDRIDTCGLCRLYHTNARYRAYWDTAKPFAEPSRTLPCVHLGPQKGEVDCSTCSGRTRLKLYVCSHPAHGETTLDYCRGCCDYIAPPAGPPG